METRFLRIHRNYALGLSYVRLLICTEKKLVGHLWLLWVISFSKVLVVCGHYKNSLLKKDHQYAKNFRRRLFRFLDV